MKTLTLTSILLLVAMTGFCTDAYQKAMTASIAKLFQAKAIPEYIEAANRFERISQIEKAEWLPLYYAAYAYIMVSFQETENEKKDTDLDQAQKFLDRAFAIDPNESELYLLQGFLYPSRINIDPMTRGMQYIGEMNQALDKAMELNPDNPRVYFLRGSMTLHTPEAYGGGAAKALPLFQAAEKKFKIFRPKTDISPNWGKEANETELKKLQDSPGK
jgi:tetratricopeptide (TPR) repeat protein